MTGEVQVGVDIGGTFTDVVLARPGRPLVLGKRLTTHADPTVAVVEAIEEVLARAGAAPGDVTRVAHATTLATNTILERRGVDVAFITTAGFRDLLTLGRAARVEEQRFDLMFDAPEPPIAPERCYEVRERISADGAVLVPFDEADAARVVGAIAATPAVAVAICFVNSYLEPSHEHRMAELCRAGLPGRSVVASASVWPEMREYERATTTLMSAYVGPVMEHYLTQLQSRLGGAGIDAPIHVMESSGGVMSAELAAARAVYTIESGPAAGVMAARAVGASAGAADVISFDMGGTTAKAGMIRNGRVEITRSFHVGGAGSFGGRRDGTGVPIKAPAIDLAEVGSGGGSIAWVDDGGALRVGPRSAGSDPGPACYGLGGTEATVTDANLVLGYLDPKGFDDGAMPLRLDLATAAIGDLAARLGAEVHETALAVHQIANANMGAAVHVVTVQRGIDPRRFTMVASGGAGPMHAARVAERFAIDEVLVPPGCGVASAIGLLATELTAERAQTMLVRPETADVAAVADLLEGLADAACADLRLARAEVAVDRIVDVRYLGQAHELSIDLPEGAVDAAAIAAVVDDFHRSYVEAYGASLGGPVELVSFRARVRAEVPTVGAAAPTGEVDDRVVARRRLVHVPEEDEPIEVPVLDRSAVGSDAIAGPLVIEEPGSTTVVPPGWAVTALGDGSLRMNHLFGSND
ncbi:MAG: hydantoinase/oxoprolinase family protein [Acidimicrobiales bacterium]|nr:hydantoinase/oxoprolinase family protein [Acidimicrobiales bacterium]